MWMRMLAMVLAQADRPADNGRNARPDPEQQT
jgi:hypothetical protein